jgi:hypothetical protein
MSLTTALSPQAGDCAEAEKQGTKGSPENDCCQKSYTRIQIFGPPESQHNSMTNAETSSLQPSHCSPGTPHMHSSDQHLVSIGILLAVLSSMDRQVMLGDVSRY